ncbi:MAG: hypothetical protein U0802_05405 [Candidatus Binatia bacterium]
MIADDGAPLPHTMPSGARFVRTLAVGVALWLLPFLVLIAWRAGRALHVQQYRFFTVAAFATFVAGPTRCWRT